VPTIVAILCFAASAIALTIGVVTEYRQTRPREDNAIVPTLPWAVASALFVVLGLFSLPRSMPWWLYPVVFIGAAFAFGYLISRAAARRRY
jgi:hypothetical protein